MFDNVAEAGRLLKKVVAELDPEVLDGPSATRLVAAFTEIERLGAAGKVLCARRVAASGAWRASGESSPAHWMARATGTSVGVAVGQLETAARLSDLPATDDAVRRGRLSGAQAREIASAAAQSPTAERDLLESATEDSLAGLKERCAKVRAAAHADESERYHDIHRRRRLRHWSDADGAFRLDALLTPDAGAALVAALEPIKERIFCDARGGGRRGGRGEPPEAYAADALVRMAGHVSDCELEPDATGPRALVHVVVDHKALVRGHTEEGETCEIPGIGPIPVASARAWCSDAFLSAVIGDGTDIQAVSHLGRTIPARLRTALVARGRKCAVVGCDGRDHLQIDHLIPVSEGGPTRLDNLDWLCPHHHYLKTHRGYLLAGPVGAREWHPPGGRGAGHGAASDRASP